MVSRKRTNWFLMCLIGCAVLSHQDVIVHECTPRFNPELLVCFLGEWYDFFSIPLDGGCVSPHQLGALGCDLFILFFFRFSHQSQVISPLGVHFLAHILLLLMYFISSLGLGSATATDDDIIS